ncbi:uncharacterized protein G2W53_044653 [Senna tora]|uniref:Uncharacterized protein n=1 Tax=Senna tora TaxID=362788 RepID=A0A834VYC5_9FABA|nr:uncharacterized protein G2W53_044653 [Senna tora]
MEVEEKGGRGLGLGEVVKVWWVSWLRRGWGRIGGFEKDGRGFGFGEEIKGRGFREGLAERRGREGFVVLGFGGSGFGVEEGKKGEGFPARISPECMVEVGYGLVRSVVRFWVGEEERKREKGDEEEGARGWSGEEQLVRGRLKREGGEKSGKVHGGCLGDSPAGSG